MRLALALFDWRTMSSAPADRRVVWLRRADDVAAGFWFEGAWRLLPKGYIANAVFDAWAPFNPSLTDEPNP